MTSNVTELNPNSRWLEISEEIKKEVWEQSACFSSESIRQRAYVNLLAQKIILSYLQEEATNTDVEENQATFWQLGVNGNAIKIDQQRLIIIPSEVFDPDELQVCQEWVDILELAADYYLAVQVDTKENLARVWGYTTHKKLKEQGTYNTRTRSYSLDREDVTEDVDSLVLIREYYQDEPTRGSIQSLPKLSLERLTQLLDTLGDPEYTFPRSVVSFQEWGAIMANENWRQTLVERRTSQPLVKRPPIVTLSEWFENKFPWGWQSINELIPPHLTPTFKNFKRIEIKRAKDLGIELSGNKLALTITIGQIESGVGIQASVYSTGEKSTLPPHLKLIILTETGDVFKEVTSLSDDEFIRYKFDAEAGDRFKVKVVLGTASIIEEFQA